jgi:hypothetical protein
MKGEVWPGKGDVIRCAWWIASLPLSSLVEGVHPMASMLLTSFLLLTQAGDGPTSTEFDLPVRLRAGDEVIDTDVDYDLLVGDLGGTVYLIENEGTAKADARTEGATGGNPPGSE